jgi:hypothetical protein
MKKVIFNENTNRYQEQLDETIIGYDVHNNPIYYLNELEIYELEKKQILESEDLKSSDRYMICLDCDNLSKFKICKKCWCFIPFKVMIEGSSCPVNKW